jgi:Ca2+-binding RTX toxin-like protein
MTFDLNGPASGTDGALTYSVGNFPTLIAPDAVLADVGVTDFRGGRLHLGLQDGLAGDSVTIKSQGWGAGQIAVLNLSNKTEILYGGQTIGHYQGSDILFDFSVPVSVAAVQALIRAISFSNLLANPDTPARTVVYDLILPDQTVLSRSAAITFDASQNIVTGDANDNVLIGTAGTDILRGGAGADSLQGGDGVDTADYTGNFGAVFVNLGSGVGQWNSAEGDQFTGIESVIGTDWDDRIFGSTGANRLTGGAGNDFLHGGSGSDIFDGGDGVDTVDYAGDVGFVKVNLNTGTGLASTGVTTGTTYVDTETYFNIENVVGSAHDDQLTGNAGANRLEGGGANDTLIGLGGADTLIGGSGRDTVTYVASLSAIQLNLQTMINTGGDAEGDVLSGIEVIGGSLFGDVMIGSASAESLFGFEGDDYMDGGPGSDSIWGYDGDDTFVGSKWGEGADSFNGGSGVDTINYSASSRAVFVYLGILGDQIGYQQYNDGQGVGQGDGINYVENVVGSALGDLLSGDNTANRLSGGTGDDTLAGGAGADILEGGDGIDTADYSLHDSRTNLGAVWVNLATGQGLWNDAEGDQLSGIENLRGSKYGDLLYGSAGTNRIEGGAGNDTLRGAGGADVLVGGDGSDTADYDGTSAAVWVHLGTGQGFWNDAEGDSLSHIENIRGSLGNDLLYGSVADNFIFGNDGNDDLGGWIGADKLDGGADSDTIDFSGDYGAVAVSLRAGVGYWNFAEGDTYFNIENVKGSIFNDFIEGNGGANVLTGAGGEDLFTFVAGFGADIITDFNGNGAASGDRVQFGSGLFTGFADLLAHSTQVGSDVVIQLDATNYLTLQGLQLGSLDASDFLF